MPFDPIDPIPILAQIGPKNFELRNQFSHIWEEEDDPFPIPQDPNNARYDLTSIPGYLTWLVPKYGKHTVAVLLHDDRIEATTRAERRARYDWMFRDALGELGVPFVRRWTLWAGTNIGTRQKRGKPSKYASWLWVAIPLFAVGVFWWDRLGSVGDWEPITWGPLGSWWQPLVLLLVAAALLLPDPYPLGLIAPPMLLLLLPATLAVLVTLVVYIAFEFGVKQVFKAANKLSPGPICS